MKKNKTNRNRKNKSVKRARKSLKGQWGKVGAPPKKTNWPSRPFTMATLFARNPNQCELSLRNKVTDGRTEKNGTGTIFELLPIKQAGGAVGRPKSRFVLKEHFDAASMTLAPDKDKAPKARTVTVAVAPAAPASAPVSVTAPAAVEAPASPAPVIETPAAPAPVIESAPVAAPAVEVTSAPATPASPEPAIG